MDQVSHLLSYPLSGWVSTDSYSLDQDIIASREALQHTAKAMGSENSLRSTSRRAENMARQHYQHQDQVMQSSSRPELHQSAFISAAALSGDGPSPYTAPYLGGGHYPSDSIALDQQQQQQLQTSYYTTASTYNAMTAATTQSQEPCYPSYPSLQLPSINNMYDGVQYSTNNYLHQQQQQQQPTYYTDGNDMMYESESRPFFDYQGYNYMDTYPAPPLPPMDADQTAFSTPDMVTAPQFPEPKTPPPPATAAAKAFDPVASEGGDDLVGLGLYDEPMSSSFLEEPMSGFNSYRHAPTRRGMGKGLKLEETFDPSALEMNLDDDDDEEEEKEKENREAKQGQEKAGDTNSSRQYPAAISAQSSPGYNSPYQPSYTGTPGSINTAIPTLVAPQQYAYPSYSYHN